MSRRIIQFIMGNYYRIEDRFGPNTKKVFFKIFKKIRLENGIKIKRINGVVYVLDLSEIVDNGIYYGNFERKEMDFLKKNLFYGDVAIDIGANVGYYTMSMAKIVGAEGRVFSFEPSNGAYKKITKNISLNKFNNIICEKIALSKKNYEKICSIRSSWRIDGNIKPEIKEKIKFMRLDDYLKDKKISKISLLKIDVEGEELNVLKGGIKTISCFKPKIIIELGHNIKELKEIIEIFKKVGYIFYTIEGKNINPDRLIDVIPNGETRNFLLKIPN